MNYLNVCKTLENSKKLQDMFHCWIRKSEIELILDKFRIVDSMGYHRIGVTALRSNLVELLSNNLHRTWIKVPAINMFKKNNSIFSLN